MKLRFFVLVICLSTLALGSSSVRVTETARPAFGTGGKAIIPSLTEMNRSLIGVVPARTGASRTPRKVSKDVSAKGAPVVGRVEESLVLPSAGISPISSAASAGFVQSPRDESSSVGSLESTPSPSKRSMYSVDDVKDIVRQALQIQHDRAVNSALKSAKTRSVVERQRLTPEEAVQLAKERKAALQERDAHIRAEKLGLQAEDAQQAMRRHARDFVNFLDTLPNAAEREKVKQDFLRAMFGSKSLSEYQAMNEVIDSLDRRSLLLRTHAQNFQDYLNTLPESARALATQKQLQNMSEYDRADVDKFVMFLGQLQPKSERALAESTERQPSESELFEQEMAADAQEIQEEDKKHLDLLARQEESIQSWNDKLKKYRGMLELADADKKPKIEALILKTERELAEMKTAFTAAIEKSSKNLTEHMQAHEAAIAEFTAKSNAEQDRLDRLNRLAREKQEREESLLAREKEIQDQKDALQKEREEHARQLKEKELDRLNRLAREKQEREESLLAREKEIQDQKDALQKEREEHARQLKEKEDELARKAQELKDKQEEMERSSSRSSSDLSGSMTRRPGMLSRSLLPAHIYYPTYHLPGPVRSSTSEEEGASKKKSWTDVFKSGATALVTGAQKAKEALSRIAASLPKGSSDDADHVSSWESSDSSDDSSSSFDDREVPAEQADRREEASHEHEEQETHEEEEEEENEPRIDFTGENFSNVG